MAEVSRAENVSYGLGNFGLGLCEYTLHFTVVALYSHVAGLRPGTITMVLVGTWCLTACICPFVGAAWDARSKQRPAYRRCLWAATAVTCAGYWLALRPPLEAPHLAIIAWLAIWLVVARSGLILFRVPYLALGATLTSDYHERTRIAGVRAAFGATGQLCGLTLAHAVFLRGDLQQPIGMLKVGGYAALGITGALLIAATSAFHTMLSPHALVHETRAFAPAGWRSRVRDSSALVSMRSSQVVLGCIFLIAVVYGMTHALCELSHGELFVASKAVITTAPTLLGALIGSLISARLRVDKRTAYVAGAAMFAIVGLLPIATRLLYVPDANDNLLHAVASIASPFVASIFGAVCPVALEAMLADISDVQRLRTGAAVEGRLFGLALALQSLGRAGGHWIDHHAIMLTLEAVGGGAEEADPWLTLKFSVVAVPVAALALLSAFVLARWQLLGVASHEEVKAMLGRRGRPGEMIDAQ